MDKICTCYHCNKKIDLVEAMESINLPNEQQEILMDTYSLLHVDIKDKSKYVDGAIVLCMECTNKALKLDALKDLARSNTIQELSIMAGLPYLENLSDYGEFHNEEQQWANDYNIRLMLAQIVYHKENGGK